MSSALRADYDSIRQTAGMIRAASPALFDSGLELSRTARHPSLAEALVLCATEVGAAETLLGLASVSCGIRSTEFLNFSNLLNFAADTYRATDETLAAMADLACESWDWTEDQAWAAWNWGEQQAEDAWDWTKQTSVDLMSSAFDSDWMSKALGQWLPSVLPSVMKVGAWTFGGFGGYMALMAATEGNWFYTDPRHQAAGLLALGRRFGQFEDSGKPTATLRSTTTQDGYRSEDFVSSIIDDQNSLYAQGNEGTIKIVKVDNGNGHYSYVIEIPGTENWSPSRTDANPADLTTNLQLMAGETTLEQRQIEVAMLAAGIGPNDPVMIAGHSQGGILAAAMASDPAFREKFNVQAVMTQGSPIAGFDIPSDVDVLAIEHREDTIPELDRATNQQTLNHRTITIDMDGADPANDRGFAEGFDVLDPHRLSGYGSDMEQLEASDDPRLEQFQADTKQFQSAGDTRVMTYQLGE